MKAASSEKFGEIDIGATILVDVPKIDRRPLDASNIIGKVIDKKNDLFKIGTSAGVLKDWLPRNSIQISTTAFNEPISTNELSLREIASKMSYLF